MWDTLDSTTRKFKLVELNKFEKAVKEADEVFTEAQEQLSIAKAFQAKPLNSTAEGSAQTRMFVIILLSAVIFTCDIPQPRQSPLLFFLKRRCWRLR